MTRATIADPLPLRTAETSAPRTAGRKHFATLGARLPRGLSALVYLLTLEAPHFIRERKMLLGIKERAERGAPWGTLHHEPV